jgi:hypothetical protein
MVRTSASGFFAATWLQCSADLQVREPCREGATRDERLLVAA